MNRALIRRKDDVGTAANLDVWKKDAGSNSISAQEVACVEKVGYRYNVKVLCTAQKKLDRVCSLLRNIFSGDHRTCSHKCSGKHETGYVNFNIGCVYVLSLSCGKE